MTSPEELEILAILGADVPELDDGLIEIPELNVRASPRGALAAFWDGYRDGRAGRKRMVNPPYDEPGVYRRAHARGVSSRKELT